MKKGFTLIELLAVIVILAIIALIATPIVLNIINDAKESATLRSAQFYLDAVEMSVAWAALENKNIESKTYDIMNDGNICLETLTAGKCIGTGNRENNEEDILKVDMDGEKPNGGTITITNGQISDISLKLSEKVIVKNQEGELALGESTDNGSADESICKLVNDRDNNNSITPGDKYQCKVKDNMEEGFEDGYFFYVLSSELDGTINLIMDRNIYYDENNDVGGVVTYDTQGIIAWLSKKDYNDDANYGEDGSNSKGPITAMNYLYNATKDWTNIPNIKMNYTEENIDGYGYGGIKTTNGLTQITQKDGTVTATYENLKARMPYKSEISDYDASKKNGYLYDHLYVACYDNNTDWNEVACSEAGYIDVGIYEEGLGSSDNDPAGYWTMSSGDENLYEDYYHAFAVESSLEKAVGLPVYYDDTDGYGVRPVINVKL